MCQTRARQTLKPWNYPSHHHFLSFSLPFFVFMTRGQTLPVVLARVHIWFFCLHTCLPELTILDSSACWRSYILLWHQRSLLGSHWGKWVMFTAWKKTLGYWVIPVSQPQVLNGRVLGFYRKLIHWKWVRWKAFFLHLFLLSLCPECSNSWGFRPSEIRAPCLALGYEFIITDSIHSRMAAMHLGNCSVQSHPLNWCA